MAGGGDGAPGAGDGGRPQRKRSGLVITDEKLLWELQNEAMGNDSWRRPAAAPPKPKPKSSAAPAQPAPAAKRPAPTAAAPASKNGSNGKMTVAAAPAFRLQPAAASSQRPPAAEAAAANGGAKRLKATLVDSYIDWRDYGGSSEESESSEYDSGSDGAGSDAGDASDGEGGDTAQRTAVEVGLEAGAPMEEEWALLPPGASAAAYVRARNAVLCAWRADVGRRLSEGEAVAAAAPADRPYALAAFRFLHAHGYINFGVSRAQHAHLAAARQDAGSVIVIGAGCAGLAAARQLRAAGYRVVMVEGRNRPGGRVWTERLEARGAAAVADIGGSIITGINGNPLAVLVKQMGLHMANIRDETPLYFADGTEPDKALDEAVEQLHNDLLTECTDMKALYERAGGDASLGTSLETLWDASRAHLLLEVGGGAGAEARAQQLFDWHLANLEFANSCGVDSLSLRHWDQDDPNEMMGAHTFLPGSNGRWVQEQCRHLPIFYGSPVREVRHCATGVEVQTDARCFRADAVVVTVPLGVLKRPDALRFSPPLTPRKQGAIRRIGFGCMNKVILLFPSAFWGADHRDMFGHVASRQSERGETFLFYSMEDISGGALLIGLCSGEAAVALERRTAAEAARRVLRVLRAIFEPRGVTVPAPLQVITTRWGSDPFAYGSYSSMPVGTRGGPDYDTLAESVGGRVFFGGEATTRKYPATMHGAFHSGLEVAANVDATLRRLRAEGGGSGVAACAAAASPAAAPRVASQVSPEAVAAAAAEVDRLAALAGELQQLFGDRQHPPDLEVGGVAAVHAPPGSAAAGHSLVQLRLAEGSPGSKGGSGERFLVLPTAAADALADAPSTAARLALVGALLAAHAPDADAAAALAAAIRRHRQQLDTERLRGQQQSAAGQAGVGGPAPFRFSAAGV